MQIFFCLIFLALPPIYTDGSVYPDQPPTYEETIADTANKWETVVAVNRVCGH